MEQQTSIDGGFLDGHLLLAMPGMSDPRFTRAVILLCAHSPDGAMGIRINQLAPALTFADVLTSLEIAPDGGANAMDPSGDIKVHRGGPVETGRGFVLHSADFNTEKSTLLIDDEICLTATLDILQAIAAGHGPRKALLALGYAGWGPGQLEDEVRGNGWLHCPAPAALIFDAELDYKYDIALAEIGIDPAMLSASAGRA